MRTLKSHSIDSAFFEHQINDWLRESGLTEMDVVSITQSSGFTTIWYWSW